MKLRKPGEVCGVWWVRFISRCLCLLLMPITSQSSGSARFGDVTVSGVKSAGLIVRGVVKPIIFIIEADLVRQDLGILNEDDQR